MNEVIIIIILILLNGLLSMSEIAVIQARKSRLSTDAKHGDRRAERAIHLAEEPDKFLSTVQIGITLIGILTGIFSGATIVDSLSSILSGWGMSTSLSRAVAQTLIVVVVTYLTILFGELLPKRIGMTMAERMAKLIAHPMQILSHLCSPVVWILAKSTTLVFNMLGLKEAESIVTEDEIKQVVQEGKDDGTVQEVEQDIVERVFVLGDLTVSSLMTFRTDIVAIQKDATPDEIHHIIEDTPHKMYPVVDGSFDNIIGCVSLKRLAPHLNKTDFNLLKAIEQPMYIHEGMSVYKALEQMKARCCSHAMICDEFGTFQGVITLRDILEGLVGNIAEKNEEPDIVVRDDHESWLVDGQCPFHYFVEYFDSQDAYEPDSDYHTVAGLILKELDHIPHTGESIEWAGLIIEIVDMDGARIDKLLVKKKATEQ